MVILAFDTTSENGGVGIFRNADCLASVPNEGPANRYSMTLFEMVERALAQANLEFREMDLFASANGPGSFTGIRVGLAAALAWARAFGRPVRGVSILDAMVSKVGLTSDWAFPVIDARRGEFFLGAFRRETSEQRSSSRGYLPSEPGGWALKPESLRTFLEERLAGGASATCLALAHDHPATMLRASLPASLNWRQVEGTLVDSIAGIALREELSCRPCPKAKLDACYIRRPDAEINWKD
jgi:tRNA threonylcarbamoyl adenosine modification protein YeaZ